MFFCYPERFSLTLYFVHCLFICYEIFPLVFVLWMSILLLLILLFGMDTLARCVSVNFRHPLCTCCLAMPSRCNSISGQSKGFAFSTHSMIVLYLFQLLPPPFLPHHVLLSLVVPSPRLAPPWPLQHTVPVSLPVPPVEVSVPDIFFTPDLVF